MSKKIINKKIISFDIDGILNNYPKCFVEYVNFLKKKKFKSIEILKKNLDKKNYQAIKDRYRRFNYKYNLKIENKLVNTINLISKKYQILIISSRPFHKYKRMYRRTFLWIKKNNIKNFKLFYKKKNIITNYKVFLHIDDREADINKIYNNQTQFFLISTEVKKRRKNIILVKKNKLITKLKNYLDL